MPFGNRIDAASGGAGEARKEIGEREPSRTVDPVGVEVSLLFEETEDVLDRE